MDELALKLSLGSELRHDLNKRMLIKLTKSLIDDCGFIFLRIFFVFVLAFGDPSALMCKENSLLCCQ